METNENDRIWWLEGMFFYGTSEPMSARNLPDNIKKHRKMGASIKKHQKMGTKNGTIRLPEPFCR